MKMMNINKEANSSCKTCKFSHKEYAGLYGCSNSKICLEFNQREDFCCNKWKGKK